MRNIFLFILCFLFVTKTNASNEDCSNYIKALKNFERYSDTQWTDYKAIPNTGYWGSGNSGERAGLSKGFSPNDAIRSMNGVALANAVMIIASPNDPLNSKRLEKIEKVLRYSALTHKKSGTNLKCNDGYQWGLGWQTNMWAGSMGLTCALLENKLPKELVLQCKKVVAAEADFRASLAPESNYVSNTAAEENAWDSNIVALAAAWMSDQDKDGKWLNAAKIYLTNTYSVENDKSGKFAKWISTVNLYPSFMLENHGFYHPGYQNVSGASLGDSYLMATLTNKKIAEELTPFAEHNVLNVWKKIRNVLKTNGEILFPCGEDWSLHNFGHVSYISYLANHFNVPEAVDMQHKIIKRLLERQALFNTGEFIGKSNENTFYVEAVTARRIALAWLHNYVNDFKLGESKQLANSSDYQDDVKILTSRSKNANVSLSYGLRILLAAESTPGNTPQTQYISCTDRYNIIGKTPYGKSLKAKMIETKLLDNGFTANLEVTAEKGKVRYNIFNDNGIVAIIQTPQSGKLDKPLSNSFSMGVENYIMNKGIRDMYDVSGKMAIKEISGLDTKFGNVINISNNYGIIYGPDAKASYIAPDKYNRRGASVDMVSALLEKPFEPAYMIIICNRNWETTKNIAKSVTFKNENGIYTLSLKSDEGKTIKLNN